MEHGLMQSHPIESRPRCEKSKASWVGVAGRGANGVMIARINKIPLSVIKLTPEILALDAEEQLLFERETQKQDVADRLLKLLMIARINKILLFVIDRLKWDIGLANDYTQTIVPQFPDYFQVDSNGDELELVCCSDKLASSIMEQKSTTSFPLQYSRGFELDKKFKKWVDDWQKSGLKMEKMVVVDFGVASVKG
ncbi:hypothetical protein LXL04_018737 [Taraxacum kok-saghyz]